jgi:hypothetical protein
MKPTIADLSSNTLEVYLAADSVFEQNNTPEFIVRRGVAYALRALAHNVDWKSGDPKFLVIDIAKELEGTYQ